MAGKQDSFDAFLRNMEQQFEWLRKKLDPNGEIPYPLDLKQEVLNPTIILDLEQKENEIKTEPDQQGVVIETDQSTIDDLTLKVNNNFEGMKAYFGMVREARDECLLRVTPPATVVVIEADLEKTETESTPQNWQKTEQIVSLGSGKHWLEVSHILLSNSLCSYTREVYKIGTISKIEGSLEDVIEKRYTMDAVVSHQNILMDLRDKLLFEPEYAGNIRKKVPPKPSLRIPWAWLPGALCLLQEVGEEKRVLDIGRTALQHPDAKLFIHDLLLSMALFECAIAKVNFEKNNSSQGFEARAQCLLRSKISIGKMTLLSHIEESTEELAPACTLELLGLPHTPENAERRLGAIAALRELLRQGLDVEAPCQVQDWPCFLNQALNKLIGMGLPNCTIVRSMVLENVDVGSLKKMEKEKVVVLVITKIFVPMVFDPGGQQAEGIMPHQSLRTRILRGRECQDWVYE